ncbi:ROK family transcriptional regulator [Kineococcus indalonis]|uniref:ROK family transcriptional regulator n=1 Tax=Kineococcus indalonis TaxID=2696566 RepID=UPI001412B671|nr:ROK family transcriptional regulator [Kineococcus indalonis]NAZ85651.1 ROK family protein [Kineococcus indalonis]
MAAKFPSRSASETGRAIVDLVRSSGVISRVELAERSGLTGASISRTVKRLLDDGLLVETGQGDPTGGKRRTLLELNTQGRYAVGVSVDDARLTYVLINLRGEVVGQLTSGGAGPAEPRVVVRRMAKEVMGLLKRHRVRSVRDVTGIGVAIPGRLDARGHSMRASREATEWEQYALESALGEATGLPVTLEHDYVCAALGEFWVGRIPATADFICFYAATGFGGGIVLEGEVYRGSSANAGEIGHMTLDVDGPRCWCGSRGCLEAFAGPRTVVAKALARRGVAARLGLTGTPQDLRADFAAVAAAAVAGDADCSVLVRESARYVSAAVLSLANVMDLDRVVLSGPAFAEAGPLYLDAAQDAVSNLSFMRQVHPVTIELSQLGLSSAAVGAATVALDENLLVPAQQGPALTRGPRGRRALTGGSAP